MAEELEYGVSGATAGASLGASLGVTGMALGPFAGVGLGIGLVMGYQQKKRKKKLRRDSDRLTATQLLSVASDTGRKSRFEAASQRALYGGSGLSMSSGSAQSVEANTMVESVLQQEATLAGLPSKHHWFKDARRHMGLSKPGRHYRDRGINTSARV